MKKFLKLCFLYGIFITILAITFSVAVDPYNIFHVDNIRVTSGDTNSNYVKTQYILNHPDKFDSFIFGSSRVGYIHVEQLNTTENRWYNMTYPNGLLPEILETVKTFVSNGVIPKNIMVGMDGVDGNDALIHQNDLLRKPYPFDNLTSKIDFYLSYLNPAVGFESLFSLDSSPQEAASLKKERFYETGGLYREGAKNYDWNRINIGSIQPVEEVTSPISNTLKVIQDLSALCEEHDINLILFTTPLHVSSYLQSLEQGYPVLIRETAKIHPVYNFCGINSVTTNNDNYWEEVHYDSNVGDMILAKIFPSVYSPKEPLPENFGILIDDDNADEIYNTMKADYSNYSY